MSPFWNLQIDALAKCRGFCFTPMSEQIFINDFDEFVSVKPGEAFRLFKYGDIYKGGKKRTVSKDKPFKLPHFKPPIKLGSHDETTPAGGFITSLEMRDDGVYCIPELNEKGVEAFEDGSYRYHSPEVIWEGGYIEDPETGNKIHGPLIVGLAMMHTPHLGEQTAFYSYQISEDNNMSELTQVVEKNTTVIEKFMSLLGKQPEPEPENEPDNFEAIQAERDDFKAQLERFTAEKEKADLMSAIRGEFDTEEYGMAYIELGKAKESAEMLAGMTEDQRKWVIDNFKAMSAQIKESALTDELGDDDPLEGGADAFDAAIKAYAAEKSVSYADALAAVAKEKPELYASYREDE